MTLELPLSWVITLNAFAWPVIQLTLAWAWTQVPASWLSPPPASSFERDGTFYHDAFSIKSWKDRLPDAASWFSGGFAKATLQSRDPFYLHRFVCETWRGELCHWSALAFTPLFFLWNPWWGNLIIVIYALTANLPCILVQRYNRIRMLHALQKLQPQQF